MPVLYLMGCQVWRGFVLPVRPIILLGSEIFCSGRFRQLLGRIGIHLLGQNLQGYVDVSYILLFLIQNTYSELSWIFTGLHLLQLNGLCLPDQLTVQRTPLMSFKHQPSLPGTSWIVQLKRLLPDGMLPFTVLRHGVVGPPVIFEFE